jgi:hypothetical protein
MHSGEIDTLNRKTHAGSRMGERSKSGSARTGQATVLVTHDRDLNIPLNLRNLIKNRAS